jgi:fucose permease
VGSYYQLSYTVVSLIFLAPFIGYSLAAISNDKLHNLCGQRGVAIIGPIHRILAYIALTQHPPYPVIIVFLVFSGFGTGLLDAAWNAYVGDFADANQILGILHAMYGLGSTLAPLIATALITQAHTPWWVYYYIPMGLNVLELGLGAWAFWDVTGAAFRRHVAALQGPESGQPSNMRAAVSSKVTWYCAAFLFVYVGLEVSLGGWLVTFMQQVRSLDPFHSGITATGFWAGLTVGRLVLGFVTPLLGERLAITIYLVAAIGLELVFWLVPSATVSAVAAALLGFSIGPLFPGAIVMTTKLLPKALHVPSIGFAAALGGGGAAVLPFAVGALAQSKGVQALEPVILVLLVADLGIWLMLPRIPRHAHDE